MQLCVLRMRSSRLTKMEDELEVTSDHEETQSDGSHSSLLSPSRKRILSDCSDTSSVKDITRRAKLSRSNTLEEKKTNEEQKKE